MTADWIARLADDERKRDGIRFRETEATSRKADLVRLHGRRLIDELRATVTRDVDAFRREFPGDHARDLVLDRDGDGGFVVTKPGYPSVSLAVAPSLETAAVSCRYRFTPNNGLPAREDRLELVFAPAADETVRFKHHGTGEIFPTSDVLSEYLLTPVFTGRPR